MHKFVVGCFALGLAACSDSGAASPTASSDTTNMISSTTRALLDVMPAMTVRDYATCDKIFDMVASEGGFASLKALPPKLAEVMDNEGMEAVKQIRHDLLTDKVEKNYIFYRGTYYRSGLDAELNLPMNLMGQSEVCGEPIGAGSLLAGIGSVEMFTEQLEDLVERELTSTENLGFLMIGELGEHFFKSDEIDVSSCYKALRAAYPRLAPSDDSLAAALPIIAAANRLAGNGVAVSGSDALDVKAMFTAASLEEMPEASTCVEAVNRGVLEYLEGATEEAAQ